MSSGPYKFCFSSQNFSIELVNFFYMNINVRKQKLKSHKAKKSTHIWSESNLVKFWIPNIPKTVLRSPQLAETDGTMGGPQIKNHTFFVLSL